MYLIDYDMVNNSDEDKESAVDTVMVQGYYVPLVLPEIIAGCLLSGKICVSCLSLGKHDIPCRGVELLS